MSQFSNLKLIKKNKTETEENIKTEKEVNSNYIISLLKLQLKWNNRFYLEKVPKYDAFHDSNCFNYMFRLKNLTVKSFKKIKYHKVD